MYICTKDPDINPVSARFLRLFGFKRIPRIRPPYVWCLVTPNGFWHSSAMNSKSAPVWGIVYPTVRRPQYDYAGRTFSTQNLWFPASDAQQPVDSVDIIVVLPGDQAIFASVLWLFLGFCPYSSYAWCSFAGSLSLSSKHQPPVVWMRGLPINGIPKTWLLGGMGPSSCKLVYNLI